MPNYYNEIDPYAAQWLRNLIDADLIARGDVDERSIVEVGPGDLKGYTQCHFFAGIGGWSLALRLAGWDDAGPVWTGSCPCQSISVAGHRKGHADKRHLWPAFQRIIAECDPATIFGEQVASADGREWLSAVRADLEQLGYAVGCADLPAAYRSEQIRQRLWWVASAVRERREKRRDFVRFDGEEEEAFEGRPVARGGSQAVEYDWIRQSPIQLLPHAVPSSMAKLRAFGNAIVPEIAAEFIGAFMECRPIAQRFPRRSLPH
jgi:DNA (cytosine-5)-methyltransferase 1